jgi:coenzyme F420 hydrogenase subunit beta
MPEHHPKSKHARGKGFEALATSVINTALCTECGTCIGICPTAAIEFDCEKEEPFLKGKCKHCNACNAICPGLDVPIADLERMVFSRTRLATELSTGIYRHYLKAYAVDPVIRQAGASGGVVSALLIYALDNHLIEGAVVAGMSVEQPWRGVPVLALTKEDILKHARSKYTLIPSNAVLREASERGLGSIGAVGLPCQVHGLRKLQRYGKPASTAKRNKFSIGLFCGANFTHEITEYAIAKYTGIPLDQVARCEYRGGPQSQDYLITAKDGTQRIIPVWGFSRTIMRTRRDRCSVCVDFSAELADVSVGDIFTPGPNVSKMPRYSAIFVRTETGETLIKDAEEAGYITTEPLDIATFQDNGGIQEKKYFAPYYLRERANHSWPVPEYGMKIPFQMPPFLQRPVTGS